MSEYQLEIKQLVDYARCRIYRQFVQSLINDRSIRTCGGSGLFYYTVLCSYANFRTSYHRIDGISYTVYPGDWVCTLKDLSKWFRTRFQWQTLEILEDLQKMQLISFISLNRGKVIKYHIKGWAKTNTVLDYNCPCQKDSGFFFLPVSKAAEIISTERCSEMDIILDLWISTIYRKARTDFCEVSPCIRYTSTVMKGIAPYTGHGIAQHCHTFIFLSVIDFHIWQFTAGTVIWDYIPPDWNSFHVNLLQKYLFDRNFNIRSSICPHVYCLFCNYLFLCLSPWLSCIEMHMIHREVRRGNIHANTGSFLDQPADIRQFQFQMNTVSWSILHNSMLIPPPDICDVIPDVIGVSVCFHLTDTNCKSCSRYVAGNSQTNLDSTAQLYRFLQRLTYKTQNIRTLSDFTLLLRSALRYLFSGSQCISANGFHGFIGIKCKNGRILGSRFRFLQHAGSRLRALSRTRCKIISLMRSRLDIAFIGTPRIGTHIECLYRSQLFAIWHPL